MSNIPWTTTLTVAAITLVSVASCASPSAKTSVAPNASGTMTVDGKTSELRHAYVIRQPPGPDDLTGYVKVLITNEPVPDPLFAKLVTDAKTRFPAYEALEGTSIRGLMLVVEKVSEKNNEHMYSGYLVAKDTIVGPHVDKLEWFSAVDGVVAGRAAAKWSDEVECAFSVRFEARSAGAFVAAAAPPVGPPLKPVAGRASGTLRVKDRIYSLTTAYAVKKRIFYDEAEEMLCILVGDKPVEGTELLHLLLQDNGPWLVEREGFHGLHLKVNQYGRVSVVQALGVHPTSYGTSYGLIASKELRFENGRVIGNATDRNRDGECEFSITFDVPISAP